MQDDAPAPMPGGGPLARPGMQQLMEQFGDAPNFEELIDNPAFRVLMQQFMQDPELLDELRQQAEEDEEERDSDEESDSEDEHDDGMIEFGDEDEDEEGLEDETPPQGDRDEVIRQMAADADMSRMEREVSMSRSGAGLFEDSFASSAGGAGGAGSAVDLDDLFNPEKVTDHAHTVRAHATESLDTLEQMLFANVFGSGFSPSMREDVAWQLALAVRQAATEHGEAADVLLSQLRARAVMLSRMTGQLLADTKVTGFRTFAFAKEMDKNGLFWHLATLQSSQWQNPGDNGVLAVSARPSMELGRAQDAISRDPVYISMFSRSTSSPYIQVDLKSRVFMPTHYTLRAATGTTTRRFMSDFSLSGSHTGHDWDVLEYDEGEGPAKPSGQHTRCVNAKSYYRFFRVEVRGHTSNRRTCLSLSHFELYGRMPTTVQDSSDPAAAAPAAKVPAAEADTTEDATAASPCPVVPVETAAEVESVFGSSIATFVDLMLKNATAETVRTNLAVVEKLVQQLPKNSLAASSELRPASISDDVVQSLQGFLSSAFSSPELADLRERVGACIGDLAERRGQLRFLGKAASELSGDEITRGASAALAAGVVERACVGDDIDTLLIDPHEDALAFVADLLEQEVTRVVDSPAEADGRRIDRVSSFVKLNVDAVLGNSLAVDVAIPEQLLDSAKKLLAADDAMILEVKQVKEDEPTAEPEPEPEDSSPGTPGNVSSGSAGGRSVMSADESEAEVVIDYQGTLDNADGVTEGSFEGSLRFNGRDNLVVVDLMYRGATPALQRLNGGPRSFDLIWDAGSGEVQPTDQCTQGWHGTCAAAGEDMILKDRHGNDIVLKKNVTAPPAPVVEEPELAKTAVAGMLQSIAKLRYEMASDKAAYVVQVMESARSEVETECVVRDATLNSIDTVSAALQMFCRAGESTASPFGDIETVTAAVEKLLAYEGAEAAEALSHIEDKEGYSVGNSTWSKVLGILQNMQAGLMAIQRHEPSKIAPGFTAAYTKMIAEKSVELILSASDRALIAAERIRGEPSDDCEPRVLQMYTLVVDILQRSCVGRLMRPWIVALDVLPWDILDESAITSLHTIEQQVARLCVQIPPSELSRIGPQHKTLAVRRVLESPHFAADTISDWKQSVRMPGATSVTVRFDPRSNTSAQASLQIFPCAEDGNSDSTPKTYSGSNQDWSRPTTFTGKPDGAVFKFNQPMERGKRYYGWKCEIIGTAVGEKLPFVPDLQASLTHVLGGHALHSQRPLPTTGPHLLYVKGLPVDTAKQDFEKAALELCQAGELIDSGLIGNAESCYGYVRLESVEDFEKATESNKFAPLATEAEVVDAQACTEVEWIRSPLLAQGVTAKEDRSDDSIAVKVFQGQGDGQELVNACRESKEPGGVLPRALSVVSKDVASCIFAAMLHHLGLAHRVDSWVSAGTDTPVPDVLRECYRKAVGKLTAFQRGQDEISMGEDQKRAVADAISSRADFLLHVSPAIRGADGAKLSSPKSPHSPKGSGSPRTPLSPGLGRSMSVGPLLGWGDLSSADDVSQLVIDFVFDHRVDLPFIQVALDCAKASAQLLGTALESAHSAIGLRDEFEQQYEAEYGAMPALRFRRLVQSQLLDAIPGVKCRQYGESVLGCGTELQTSFMGTVRDLLSEATGALEFAAGQEPEPEPEEEKPPEFLHGDEDTIQKVVEYSGVPQNVAMWALWSKKWKPGRSMDGGEWQAVMEWAITEGTAADYIEKKLPAEAYKSEEDAASKRGPLSATKATQAQCIALAACSVIWRVTDARWLVEVKLPSRLFAAALSTDADRMQKLCWASLNSLILTVFAEPSGHANALADDAVAALQKSIVDMLLQHVQKATHDQEESSENILRVIAMLAACFSSRNPTVDMYLGDVLQTLCDLVLPVPRKAVADDAGDEDGQAEAEPAAPQPVFKYEFDESGQMNQVEQVVEITQVSEKLARWALLGAFGNVGTAIERAFAFSVDPEKAMRKEQEDLPPDAFGGGETSPEDQMAAQLLESFDMMVMMGSAPAPVVPVTANAAKRALAATNVESLEDMQQVQRAVDWLAQHSADPHINDEFVAREPVVFQWDDDGTWTDFEDMLQSHFNQRLETRQRLDFSRGRDDPWHIEFRGESEIVLVHDATGREHAVRTVSQSEAKDAGKNAFEVDRADVKPAALATLRKVLASATPDQCSTALADVETKLAGSAFGPDAGDLVASLFVLASSPDFEMDFRFAVGLLIELAWVPCWAVALQSFIRRTLSDCAAEVESDVISLRCKLALLLNGGYAEIVRLGADVRMEDGEARVIRFKPGEAKASVCMAETSVVKEVESDKMSPFCNINLNAELLGPMVPIAQHLIAKAGSLADPEMLYASSLALRAFTDHLSFSPNSATALLLSANVVPPLTQIALKLEATLSTGKSKVTHELQKLEERIAAFHHREPPETDEASTSPQASPALKPATAPPTPTLAPLAAPGSPDDMDIDDEDDGEGDSLWAEDSATLGTWTAEFELQNNANDGDDAPVAPFDIDADPDEALLVPDRARAGFSRVAMWRDAKAHKDKEAQLLKDCTKLVQFASLRAVMNLLENKPQAQKKFNVQVDVPLTRLLRIAMMTDFALRVKPCLANLICADGGAQKLETEALRNIRSTRISRTSLGPVTQTVATNRHVYDRSKSQRGNRNPVQTEVRLGFPNASEVKYHVSDDSDIQAAETLTLQCEGEPAHVMTGGADIQSKRGKPLTTKTDEVKVLFDNKGGQDPALFMHGYEVTATADTDVAKVETCHPVLPGTLFETSIKIEGASSLEVVFDERCELGESDYVQFADSSNFDGNTRAPRRDLYRVHSDNGHFQEKPVKIKGPQVFFRYECRPPRRPGQDSSWGVAFTVKASTDSSLSPTETASLDVSLLSLQCILDSKVDEAEPLDVTEMEPEPEPEPEPETEAAGSGDFLAAIEQWAQLLTNAALRVPGEPRRKLLGLTTKLVRFGGSSLQANFEPLRMLLCNTYDDTLEHGTASTKYFGSGSLQSLASFFLAYKKPHSTAVADEQVTDTPAADPKQWIQAGRQVEVAMARTLGLLRHRVEMKLQEAAITGDDAEKLLQKIAVSDVAKAYELLGSDNSIQEDIDARRSELDAEAAVRVAKEAEEQKKAEQKREATETLMAMGFPEYQIPKALESTTGGIEGAANYLFGEEAQQHRDDVAWWAVAPEPAPEPSGGPSGPEPDESALFELRIASALAALETSCSSEELGVIIEVLQHMLTTLVEYPEDPRWRCVDYAGFDKRIGSKPGAVQVLQACGFAIDEDEAGLKRVLKVPATPPMLAERLQRLKDCEWSVAKLLLDEADPVDVSWSSEGAAAPTKDHKGMHMVLRMTEEKRTGSPLIQGLNGSLLVQSPVALSHSAPYFEVEVMQGAVTLALGHTADDVGPTVLPSDDDSEGGADIWDGVLAKFRSDADPLRAETGDKVGVGLQIGFDKDPTGKVILTKNGEVVSKHTMSEWAKLKRKPIHPTLIFESKGSKVKVVSGARCDACQLSGSHTVFDLLSKCQVALRFAEALMAGQPAPATEDFPFDIGSLNLNKNLWLKTEKLGAEWGYDHDVQLVRLIGKVGEKELPAEADADAAVLPEEPAVARATHRLKYFPLLQHLDHAALQTRAKALVAFGRLVSEALPLVDLSGRANTLGPVLAGLRALLPPQIKAAIESCVRDDLSRLRPPSHPPTVYIDRIRASAADQDPSGRSSIFGQIYRELGPLARDMSTLTPGVGEGRGARTQWWVSNFHNEAIQDAAGGFRDTVSSIGQDLMSERTPLFRPAGAAGFFVPSPLCQNFEMYEFVGRLMAACILSEERLVVTLPTYIWKKLAQIPVTLEDYYDPDEGVGDKEGEYVNKLTFLRKAVEADPEVYAEGFGDVLGFDVKFELPVVSSTRACHRRCRCRCRCRHRCRYASTCANVALCLSCVFRWATLDSRARCARAVLTRTLRLATLRSGLGCSRASVCMSAMRRSLRCAVGCALASHPSSCSSGPQTNAPCAWRATRTSRWRR
jgi:hypothetical protein